MFSSLALLPSGAGIKETQYLRGRDLAGRPTGRPDRDLLYVRDPRRSHGRCESGAFAFVYLHDGFVAAGGRDVALTSREVGETTRGTLLVSRANTTGVAFVAIVSRDEVTRYFFSLHIVDIADMPSH